MLQREQRVLCVKSVIGRLSIKKLHIVWSFLKAWDDLANLISEPDCERITDVFDDKKTDKNTKNRHLTESFHEAHTHPPENETDKESCEITIPDSWPCFAEPELQRSVHIFSVVEKVSYTFEEENIRVNGNAKRENNTSNTRESECYTHDSHKTKE